MGSSGVGEALGPSQTVAAVSTVRRQFESGLVNPIRAAWPARCAHSRTTVRGSLSERSATNPMCRT